jgi:DNA-binding transcriptional MerR regulator
MVTPLPSALTIGEIAKRTGCPIHRVRYVVDTRGISPVSRAGSANIYSEADVAHIAGELRRIAEDKGIVS